MTTETTNFGLKKPGAGSVGWGADVNANFDEHILRSSLGDL